MEPQQQDNRELQNELQCRKLLLDFYSAELQAHSRLIIGFALVLLTLFQIKLQLKPILPMQSNAVYLGIFLAALAFWFSLMRLLTYGLLVDAATTVDPTGQGHLLARVKARIAQNVLKRRILGVVPSCLFFTAGQKYVVIQRLLGIGLCAFFAFVIMFVAQIIMG